MKALSIRPPWSWLIVKGEKPVENREWETKYTGPLLIHASKTFEKADWNWIRTEFPHIDLPRPIPGGVNPLYHPGHIIGRVDMFGCLPIDFAGSSPWAFGPHVWYFRNPVEFFHPIPWKGQLGIFNVPERLLEGVV